MTNHSDFHQLKGDFLLPSRLHNFCNVTQVEGEEERFNGSLTREFLKYEIFEDFEDAKIKLDKYRNFYNTKNPPFALNSGFFIFNSQHSSKWCSVRNPPIT